MGMRNNSIEKPRIMCGTQDSIKRARETKALKRLYDSSGEQEAASGSEGVASNSIT